MNQITLITMQSMPINELIMLGFKVVGTAALVNLGISVIISLFRQ